MHQHTTSIDAIYWNVRYSEGFDMEQIIKADRSRVSRP
jgi:hypothetical protein